MNTCGSTDTSTGKPCGMTVSSPDETCRYHSNEEDNRININEEGATLIFIGLLAFFVLLVNVF